MGLGTGFRGALVGSPTELVDVASFRRLRSICFAMLIGLRFMAGAIDGLLSMVRDRGGRDTGSARW